MINKLLKNIPGKKNEKGQVLVILALTLLGVIAIIGLAVDTGYLYVSYARVRRAVDAAALAATGEFKRNYTVAGMTASATQMLQLNGIVTTADSANPDAAITIDTCDTAPGDPDLCPQGSDPAKKMVRVSVTQDVPTFFLAVVGITKFPITVQSLSQAASVDVVLLIQNSEAMTYGNAIGTTDRDPSVCSPANTCQPFQDVKSAAEQFTQTLYFPYDRVALVTYNRFAVANDVVLPLTDDNTTVNDAIANLTVFQTDGCQYTSEDIQNAEGAADPTDPSTWVTTPPSPWYSVDPQGPCRLYSDAGVYQGYYECPMARGGDPDLSNADHDWDPSYCGSTDPAAGLATAGNLLQGVYPIGYGGLQPTVRDDAVWVILMLSTGAPNSAFDDDSNPICPQSTREHSGCRDQNVLTRHCKLATDLSCINASYPSGVTASVDETNYDAYDRAYDMADLEAKNSIYIFTIGLGPQVQSSSGSSYDVNGMAPGETFLKYTANAGGGIYRYAPSSSDLLSIFLEIANKIATKITQ